MNQKDKTTMNSRQLAKIWPYPRQKPFVEVLQKAASLWFNKHGFTTHPKMPYCLDKHDNWTRNIILKEVAAYIQAEQNSRLTKDAFPLHKYLHHGLSSQALLFNLVGPMITRNDFTPLQTVLINNNIPWPEGIVQARFEDDDRRVFNEDSGQPTSIDCLITSDGNETPLFIESKFVEKEFGGCSVFSEGDCDGQNPLNDLSSCYLHHIGRLYWKRMEEHGFLNSPMVSDHICPFTIYYQFFREAMYAIEKKGHFILLHDERNPVFIRTGSNGSPQRGLWPLLLEMTPANLKPFLHAVSFQQVVREIEKSIVHADWIGIFKEKYDIQ